MGDYAEIVKALRLCSAVNSSCEECLCNDPADDLCECANKVSIAAADAIENLLIENAALRRQIGNLTDEKAALVKELHDSKSESSAAIAGQELESKLKVVESNEPLTLDELRKMDGEPVWIAGGRFWALVNTHSFGYIALIENSGEIAKAKGWMKHMGAIYRRKPEGV